MIFEDEEEIDEETGEIKQKPPKQGPQLFYF